MTQYIVAGNHKEYLDFLCTQGGRASFKYVYNAESIRGLNDVHGFFIGTHLQRPDINEIKLMIKISHGKILGKSATQIIMDEILIP